MSDDAFRDAYNGGRAQLLNRALVSDLETPVSAFLKLAGDDANAFLLESVEGGEQLGRYSIIGLAPDAIWRCAGGRSEINHDPSAAPEGFAAEDGAPLTNLRGFLDRSAIPQPAEDLPPMAAGVFGYIGYDMVRQMERLGPRPPGGLDVPDALLIRPTIVAVFDNIRQRISVFTPVRPRAGVDAEGAFDAAEARLDLAVSRLQRPLEDVAASRADRDSAAPEMDVASTMTQSAYEDGVTKIKEYIVAGDIFQAVLSQRFSAPLKAAPFDVYRALRRSNPSPFLFFLRFAGLSLIGSSPEILVRVRDGDITIRPIAGTRPRGATPAEDKTFEESLLADPKERAEHLMLLDLGRNDAGRFAELGSVRVTDQFIIERYSHVMHIVSNVTARLRADAHPLDAVAAGFPAGTVSGAPKIRAMEIIDEIEPTARGVYGGAIGYFSAFGDVDTCIALRTAVVRDGAIYVQAGAGIVADSDPAGEHRECVNKAKALFAAAAQANAGAAEEP